MIPTCLYKLFMYDKTEINSNLTGTETNYLISDIDCFISRFFYTLFLSANFNVFQSIKKDS